MLEGFVEVRLKGNKRTLSVTERGVHLNCGLANCLGNPAEIKLFFNERTKELALVPVAGPESGYAVKRKFGGGAWVSSASLAKWLAREVGWTLDGSGYRATVAEVNGVMVAALGDAVRFNARRNSGKGGNGGDREVR